MENETIKHSSIGEEYVANILAQEEDLEHHGIKGQRWGRRRWQNDDGSLTPAGRIRYGQEIDELEQRKEKLINAREMAKHDPDIITSSKNARKAVNKLYNEKISDLDKEISDGKRKIQESLDKESANRKTIRELAEKQLEESRKQAEKAAEERRKETEKREAEREKKEADKKAKQEKEEADKKKEDEEKKKTEEKEKTKPELAEERQKREQVELLQKTTHEKWKQAFDPDKIKEKERQEQLKKEYERLSAEKQVFDSAKSITTDTKGLASAIYNRKSSKVDKMDMSQLTNREMQERIDRYNLEQRYDAMFNTKRKEVESGRERVNNILETAGSALAIAGSVVGLMAAIKQLKMKNS